MLFVDAPAQGEDLPDVDLVVLGHDVVLEILGGQLGAHGKGDGWKLFELLLILKLSISRGISQMLHLLVLTIDGHRTFLER